MHELSFSVIEIGFLPGLSLDPRGTKWVSYTVRRADLTYKQEKGDRFFLDIISLNSQSKQHWPEVEKDQQNR